MSFLKIQNLNISYKISGQGQKILLLHGWGTDLSYFNDLVKLLVADEFQVVAVDLPGFGRSDSLDQGWSVDDYADFTNEFINNLNINDCYLLGHSFGGRIGIKLAAGQPDWLKGLILVNSAGLKPRKTFKRIIFQIIAKAGKLFFSLPLLSKLQSSFKKFLYRLAGEQDYLQSTGIMKETFKKVIAEDLKPVLPQIKLKTLIVWGKNDTFTPLADGQTLNKLIKNSRLIIVDNVGHNLPRTRPADLIEPIKDFIR